MLFILTKYVNKIVDVTVQKNESLEDEPDLVASVSKVSNLKITREFVLDAK